jgi:Arc/MetJ-type ribon-helix-helix transcriptional regulator
MKTYIHARLSKEDRAILEELKKSTGRSESELVREGLSLIRRQLERQRNALELAGNSSGKFAGGPKDLATNKEHLAEFGR